MKMKCIVILFVSLCMASSLLSSEATISIPQDATAVERYAAEELASYFNKIYAVTPEIRENAPNVPIQIGGDRESTEDLGLEGFEIQGDGSRLYIRGGTRRGPGILYGVYEYLERLGCRFLTKNVDYIPRRKTFELLKLELREKPSFEKLRYVYASGRFGVKMRTNFFSGNDRDKYEKLGLLRYAFPDGKNGHSTFFFLPPEKYAEKHPEWYAIHKGKRSFLTFRSLSSAWT